MVNPRESNYQLRLIKAVEEVESYNDEHSAIEDVEYERLVEVHKQMFLQEGGCYFD